jgi:hypothetical protein
VREVSLQEEGQFMACRVIDLEFYPEGLVYQAPSSLATSDEYYFGCTDVWIIVQDQCNRYLIVSCFPRIEEFVR